MSDPLAAFAAEAIVKAAWHLLKVPAGAKEPPETGWNLRRAPDLETALGWIESGHNVAAALGESRIVHADFEAAGMFLVEGVEWGAVLRWRTQSGGLAVIVSPQWVEATLGKRALEGESYLSRTASGEFIGRKLTPEEKAAGGTLLLEIRSARGKYVLLPGCRGPKGAYIHEHGRPHELAPIEDFEAVAVLHQAVELSKGSGSNGKLPHVATLDAAARMILESGGARASMLFEAVAGAIKGPLVHGKCSKAELVSALVAAAEQRAKMPDAIADPPSYAKNPRGAVESIVRRSKIAANIVEVPPPPASKGKKAAAEDSDDPTDAQQREMDEAQARGEFDEAEPGRFRETDLGNGERLRHRHGQNMRHCTRLGGWLIFDKRRWKLDENGKAQRLAKKTVRAIFAEAEPIEAQLRENGRKIIDKLGTDEERKAWLDETKKLEAKKARIYRWAIESEGESRVRAMLSRGSFELPIAAETHEFDADPWVFNTTSGTLDLRTSETRPHRREDMITKLAGAAFDPSAKLAAWDEFLATVTCGDAERLEFLQRWAGYALTGDTREDVVLLIDGPGGSGKSTFVAALKAAFGDYAKTIPFAALLKSEHGSGGDAPRPDIAGLVGARLVVAVEVEDGKSFDAATLKTLSGGDEITARFLHANSFTFKPVCKLLLVANDLPRASSKDSATWRRFKRVMFAKAIERPDTGLRDRLQQPDARQAVLAWAYAGFVKYRRDGLREPKSVVEATAAMRARLQPRELVELFVNECCVLDDTARTPSSALYTAFKAFCTERRTEPLTETAFGTALTRLGFPSWRDMLSRAREGIRLREEKNL